MSQLVLQDHTSEPIYKTATKIEFAPADCKGRVLRIGDKVESIGAPYHNGTIEDLDDQWAYIKTKYSSKPRKKAPYNLLKKNE